MKMTLYFQEFQERGMGMNSGLKAKADEILSILCQIPGVKTCALYGSLAERKADDLSDIDIQIDVSGMDNGKFMLNLVELLKAHFEICYSDYAPSLVPEKYIVSIAVNRDNPFEIVDLWCTAQPHCTTVTRQQVMARNELYPHILKLWTANLKHYARGNDCYDDILRMAGKIGVQGTEQVGEDELLEETLFWLEKNAESSFQRFISSCRTAFETLVG